jgi:hypothetical protein
MSGQGMHAAMRLAAVIAALLASIRLHEHGFFSMSFGHITPIYFPLSVTPRSLPGKVHYCFIWNSSVLVAALTHHHSSSDLTS